MTAARDHIYAVLMAIADDTVLLPNAAVAEVVSRDTLRPAWPGAPAWMIGYCDWGGRRVPVVNFEAMNGATPLPMTRRSRVVVMNSLGTHLSTGHFAVVAQGYPHLVTLNRAAVKAADLRDTDRGDLVLSRVRIASQEALVPDLDTVEAEIARAQTPM